MMERNVGLGQLSLLLEATTKCTLPAILGPRKMNTDTSDSDMVQTHSYKKMDL